MCGTFGAHGSDEKYIHTRMQILIGNLKRRIRSEYLGSNEWKILNSILRKQDAMMLTGLN
jgi:hypothetical protein